MVLALPDFFQIMLKIMLGFENYARFCKVCFSNMKHKTCQNYNFFAPIKHNYIFNMFWHFVACGSGSKDRSNLYFWGVPSPLDDDQRSIAVTIDRPWKWPTLNWWSILAIKQVMTLVKFLWKKNICWLCCKKWKIRNRKYGLERRNLRWECHWKKDQKHLGWNHLHGRLYTYLAHSHRADGRLDLVEEFGA